MVKNGNKLLSHRKTCKFDKLLSENAGNEIYTLIEFLDALGYRIALVPKE